LKKKFWIGIYDAMLVKYGSITVGYAIIGLPVFGRNSGEYLAKYGDD